MNWLVKSCIDNW